MSTTRKSILGRGCDPVRAAFAKKQWEPALNADIHFATSDDELARYLSTGKIYDIFAIAPGYCSLVDSGCIDGDKLIAQVRKHQPQITVVRMRDVSEALPLLSQALGRAPIDGISANSIDWPFVD